MTTGDMVVRTIWAIGLIVLASSMLVRYRGHFASLIRDLLVWAALGIFFLGAYAYRDALRPVYERVQAEIQPGYVIDSKPGIAEVARRRDGHFVLRMKANGVDLPFLFDTGASLVTLRAEDARKLGIDMKSLRFTETVSTANGVARAALTRLDSLSVGSISQRRVEAMVAREGALNENLLGQNFLDGLAGYGVENGRLALRGR